MYYIVSPCTSFQVVNHNIPYSDTFYVACRYCMTRVTHNQTRLRITANIKFKKTCWGLVKSKCGKCRVYVWCRMYTMYIYMYTMVTWKVLEKPQWSGWLHITTIGSWSQILIFSTLLYLLTQHVSIGQPRLFICCVDYVVSPMFYSGLCVNT